MTRLGRLLRLQYSSPLCTIQVFDGETPVAELSRQQGRYLFRYLETFKRKGLTPFAGLPDIDEVYESAELFPYFEERIPDTTVPAIRNWISRKGLAIDDKLTLLFRVTGLPSVPNPGIPWTSSLAEPIDVISGAR